MTATDYIKLRSMQLRHVVFRNTHGNEAFTCVAYLSNVIRNSNKNVLFPAAFTMFKTKRLFGLFIKF